MIRFEGVEKRYPSGRGLLGVDLDFGPGIHGLIGRNGAGKTTALKLVIGLLKPDRGRVTIDGLDPSKDGDGWSFRREIGYFPSDDYFFHFLSGRRNLRYLGYLRCGDSRAYEPCLGAAEALGIGEVLDESFASYSAGTKRKAQLVGSLVGDPGILVWDEPNNGVDLASNIYIRALLERMRGEGRTVILSSHVLEFMAGLVDSVAILDEGRVVARESPVRSDLSALFLSSLGAAGT
jgi:ABC-type multidrug transport system ATPase subunit